MESEESYQPYQHASEVTVAQATASAPRKPFRSLDIASRSGRDSRRVGDQTLISDFRFVQETQKTDGRPPA